MTAKKWVNLIKKQMETNGVYKDSFVSAVNALGEILEQRDKIKEEYDNSGQGPVVEHISDRGAVQYKANPMLKMWMDLNAQALTYWKDLGLTPAGLKKINDTLAKIEVKESALEKALKCFGS